MMRRLLLWTPRRWPVIRLRTALVCAIILGAVQALESALDYRFRRLPDVADIDRGLNGIKATLSLFMALIFGFYRAGTFHPVRDKAYLNWLKTSPWHAGLPLPLGPVALQWQDAAVLAILSVPVVFGSPFPPESIIAAFGTAYLFRATFLMTATNQYTVAFVLGLALAGILRFVDQWHVVAGIVVVVYPLVHYTIKRSLHDFPWEAPPEPPSGRNLGATFPQLGPQDPTGGIKTVAAIEVSLLLGAWTYAVFERVGLRKDDTPLLVTVFVWGLLLALIRWVGYAGGHGAPLTLKARLATGKWIIPRYDKILIVPLIITMWTVTFPFFIPGLAARNLYPIYAGAFVAITLTLACIPGPTKRAWTLAGFCHVNMRETPGQGRHDSDES